LTEGNILTRSKKPTEVLLNINWNAGLAGFDGYTFGYSEKRGYDLHIARAMGF
jgi:hypothetical protein